MIPKFKIGDLVTFVDEASFHFAGGVFPQKKGMCYYDTVKIRCMDSVGYHWESLCKNYGGYGLFCRFKSAINLDFDAIYDAV